jgi:hypothetical protein
MSGEQHKLQALGSEMRRKIRVHGPKRDEVVYLTQCGGLRDVYKLHSIVTVIIDLTYSSERGYKKYKHNFAKQTSSVLEDGGNGRIVLRRISRKLVMSVEMVVQDHFQWQTLSLVVLSPPVLLP